MAKKECTLMHAHRKPVHAPAEQGSRSTAEHVHCLIKGLVCVHDVIAVLIERKIDGKPLRQWMKYTAHGVAPQSERDKVRTNAAKWRDA